MIVSIVWPAHALGATCCSALSGGKAPPGRRAVVFVHEMRTPAGEPRLVKLDVFPDQPTFVESFIAGYNWDSRRFKLATWSVDPAEVIQPYMISVLAGLPRQPPRMRVYAGHLDPQDPSHLTFRYEMWGQSDVADGRLDNAGRLTLTQRNRPQPPRDTSKGLTKRTGKISPLHP